MGFVVPSGGAASFFFEIKTVGDGHKRVADSRMCKVFDILSNCNVSCIFYLYNL